jgi:hypothetical protein
MAVTDRPAWGADVPISMPVPAGEDVIVPMYGFGMTQYRLVHDLTSSEYEDLAVPVYAPDSPQGSEVAGDAGIDATGKSSG